MHFRNESNEKTIIISSKTVLVPIAKYFRVSVIMVCWRIGVSNYVLRNTQNVIWTTLNSKAQSAIYNNHFQCYEWFEIFAGLNKLNKIGDWGNIDV